MIVGPGGRPIPRRVGNELTAGARYEPAAVVLQGANGSAASLRDVVDFYDARFGLGLSDAQKSDLVAFLRTL
jgi:hypothetical protein